MRFVKVGQITHHEAVVAIEPTAVFSLTNGDFLAALAARPSVDDLVRVFFSRR